jgi:hypothetical protein
MLYFIAKYDIKYVKTQTNYAATKQAYHSAMCCKWYDVQTMTYFRLYFIAKYDIKYVKTQTNYAATMQAYRSVVCC